MNEYQLPKCLQVIGLACIPVNDIPDQHPALARRPVAAAVLTMVDQDDGHRWINTICVSDARKSDRPPPSGPHGLLVHSRLHRQCWP